MDAFQFNASFGQVLNTRRDFLYTSADLFSFVLVVFKYTEIVFSFKSYKIIHVCLACENMSRHLIADFGLHLREKIK